MTFDKWWDDQNIFWGDVPKHIALRIYASILTEREECAKVCEELRKKWMKGECVHTVSDFLACAGEIRKRSN